jgi:serine phosphatase RsbU (regulator of sigma subunit)
MKISGLKKYSLLLLFFAVTELYSQQKLDSIKKVASIAVDTERVNTMNILSKYYRSKDMDTSRNYADRAIALASKIGFEMGLALAYNNLGIIYARTGSDDSALKYVQKARNIWEKYGDKPGIAGTWITVGNIYNTRKFYREAIRSFSMAVLVRKVGNSGLGLGMGYTSLSLAYHNINKFDSAIYYNLKGLEIYRAAHDTEKIATSLQNLVNEYENTDLEKARRCGEEAIKLSEMIDDKANLAYALIGQAHIYMKLKNFAKAKEYLEKGIPLGEALQSLDLLEGGYDYLAQIAAYNGDFKAAYDHVLKKNALHDSIMSAQTNEQILDVQKKYESAKKDRDLILKDNEIDKQTAHAEKQSLQRNAFIIGFILVAFLAAFIFRSYRQKKKDNVIITKQKEEVEEQKKIVEGQKHIVEEQKELILEKQKEVLDSIHYAQRIQKALLAGKQMLDENLGEKGYTLYFNPKDIVSGDFYWATEHNGLFYIAICDSTGHGVPGAFMSLLNMGFLSEAIKEKDIVKPGDIFTYVRKRLIDTISKDGQKDGFDGIMLCMDKKNKKITYAAAYNAPVLISEGEMIQLDADKMPVGKGERPEDFTTYDLSGKNGDILFLYTDGYADQFGGPKGKKFKYKQLNDLLINIVKQNNVQQLQTLKESFEGWRGELEQVDDVLLIGISL